MVAVIVVALELVAISYIRYRYMDTPFLSAAFQVVVGGALVFLAGILIGNAVMRDVRAGASVGPASRAAAEAAPARARRQARDRLHQLAAQAQPDPPRATCWRASSPTSRRRRPTTSR